MDELAVFLSYVLNEKIPLEHLEDILSGKSEYEYCMECVKGYREVEALASETVHDSFTENQKAFIEGDIAELKEMIDDIMYQVGEMEIKKISER